MIGRPHQHCGPLVLLCFVLVLALGPGLAAAQSAAPRDAGDDAGKQSGLGAAIGTEPAQTSLTDIEDEVMCPVCGTILELAESSPQAARERAYINLLVSQGLSKDEIKAALVQEYGPEVLALPSTEGFDLAAWIVPIAGFGIGLIVIVVAARRWRGTRPAGPGVTANAPAAGIDPGDEERLRADLGRYEL